MNSTAEPAVGKAGFSTVGWLLTRGRRRRALLVYVAITCFIVAVLAATWPSDEWSSADTMLVASSAVATMLLSRVPVASLLAKGLTNPEDLVSQIWLSAPLVGLIGVAGDARVAVVFSAACVLELWALQTLQQRSPGGPYSYRALRILPIRVINGFLHFLVLQCALLSTTGLRGQASPAVTLILIVVCFLVAEVVSHLHGDAFDVVIGRPPVNALCRDAIWLSPLFAAPTIAVAPLLAAGNEAILAAVGVCAVWSIQMSVLCGALLSARSRAQEQSQLAKLADDRARRALDRAAAKLHDGPMQILHSQRLALENADEGATTADDLLIGVRDRLQCASAELRSVAAELTATPEPRLVDVIEEELRLFNPLMDGQVAFSMLCDVEPDPEASFVIVGVVHEALRNVARHSQARSAAVEIRGDLDRFEIVVVDDGIGFEGVDGVSRRTSMGLKLIERSVLRLGGRVDIQSTPGGGTTVRALVPTERPSLRQAVLHVQDDPDRDLVGREP